MNTIEQIKAEIERRKGICTAQIKANPEQTFPFVMEMTGYDKILSFLSTLESEKPTNMEAVKWLVDDDYHEASEKGRFILGSVGLGYNGYYIPYLDLLKLPKEG